VGRRRAGLLPHFRMTVSMASGRGRSQFDPQSPANPLDGVEPWLRLGPERLVERFAGQSGRLRNLGHASSASHVPQRRGQESRVAVFDGQPDVIDCSRINNLE